MTGLFQRLRDGILPAEVLFEAGNRADGLGHLASSLQPGPDTSVRELGAIAHVGGIEIRAPDGAVRPDKDLDDDGGTLKPVAREILRLAADKGVAVSFAHSSKPEMEALAEECTRIGYHQAFIDHPYGPQVGLQLEDLAPFAEAGIHFNFTYDEISPLLGVDPKDMMDTIRTIGPEHFTLSSDGGNPLLPGAVEALSTLVRFARAYGMSDEEIHQMTVENPRRVLGLSD
jgi:hypothetical protein